ncbi:universal stress protein [Actinoplanes sichuanensis]|uniref:Universal stress protein n=1 Tax=Actinoplanes sichuanensis TaxID=512349 RepID=A0ABW4AM23_9ACTN|nr:universal stress protein [Actinoplanes sichuanensis]BEL05981.1 universal stress protein [Actinoplanes sichuanensis]
MNERSNVKAETEARRHSSAVSRENRYSQVINRYLGAVNYPDPYAVRPLPSPIHQLPPPLAGHGFVLAGVDDSPISYVAADHAAIEAELHGWDLRLVTVQHSAGNDNGAALLQRLTERMHASSATVAVNSTLAVAANPAQVLLAEADGAALTVIGHRHGATTTALGRSVAGRVARHHHGPVLVVRMPDWPAGAEFGRRPLVVGVDGSAPAQQSVEFALAEARVRGCSLNLLHVAGDRMDLARRLETRDGVTVHHRIISGDLTAALIEASGRAAAIVVGRYRHGAWSGSLLHPAAAQLTQHALCPVFLVG